MLTVSAYERTSITGVVEADSEAEAVERAWRGDWHNDDFDTEPGGKIDRRRWSAEPK